MDDRTQPAHRNPVPTVDLIIELPSGKIVMVKRRNPPAGFALPGGFVDVGESLEHAACREALEETGLAVRLVRQFHTYSDPARDPRLHTITTVFVATAAGMPVAGDDAAAVLLVDRDSLPEQIAFDHRQILWDYFDRKY
jgi:ADP-ribose pyrophosphatase YjhB (NUDIX family)